MLTQETKRKIDSARDILVGKIPDPKAQVEQITTALIYKFMDDMDKESMALPKGKAQFFTSGFEKYAWSKLMDPKLGGHERLNLYGESIAKMPQNPHIPQLFRDIFKDTFLPYRDPETLSLFLKEINGFTYDHSEDLGDAFEYLLSVLGSQGDAGQFRTPRHIIDFIVEVVDPKKGDSVLDPACGTAGFLISAYKHILKLNKDKPLTPDEKKRLMTNLVGHDISPDMVKLSRVNMYLHGFPSPHIHEYDTLTSEEHWDDRYDVIMANPPFMTPKGGIRPHKRFSVQANKSEVLFVAYIMEHLNNKGRAGVIVPEGIIFQSSGAYKQLRKQLVEDGLYAVASLPQGVFNPYAGVKTSILFFDNDIAKRSKDILFIKILNDGFDLGAQRRPIDKNDLPVSASILIDYKNTLLKGEGSIGNIDAFIKHFDFPHSAVNLVSKAKITESGDYNLSGDRYRVVVSHDTEWPKVEVGDLCEIQNGFAFNSEEFSEDKGFPIIRIRNIKTGYTDTKYKGKFSDAYVVKNGDLIIGMDGEFNTTIWNGGDALLNQRVCRLQNFKNCLKDYVYLLIQKSLKEIESSTYAVTVKHISSKQIQKIKIPLPPLEVQQQIVAELDGYQKIIDGADQIVANYKPTIKIDSEWKSVKLGNLAKFIRGPFGGSLKKEIFKPSGYLVYEQYHAINNDFTFERYFIDEKKFQEMKRFEVLTGDILVSCSGTMGKIAIVPKDHKIGIINQALLKLTPDKEEVVTEYLVYVLESDLIQNKYFRNQSGVAIQNVASVKVLSGIDIPLPSLEVQKQIVAKIGEEKKHIESAKEMTNLFDQKIKSKIAEIWGE